MSKRKPTATISIDLDNQWSYMKTHGDAGWDSFPTYMDVVIPRILTALRERQIRATFFIVGQDAARPENAAAFKSLAMAGHEIGNHSFHHETWLHMRPEDEIASEIATAAQQIEHVTGVRPVGFRGPGYGCSETLLHVLKRQGYEYDASTLPTFLGPLARAYYFLTARLSLEEKRKRSKLFGTIRDGLRPLRPYRWRLASESSTNALIEIPVTTMPLLRIPFHVSYILYLATFSRSLALAYFRLALALCRLRRVEPSLLLHPLDFLGADDLSTLSFFPAMQLTSSKKLALVHEVLDIFAAQCAVLPLHQYVLQIARQEDCPAVVPSFQIG